MAIDARREKEIGLKREAITRKLQATNTANKVKADQTFKKTGKGTTYSTQRMLGQKEGFTNSDFGVGAGAAIPYQLKTENYVAGPGAKVTDPKFPTSKVTNPKLPAPSANITKPKLPVAANLKQQAIQRRLIGPAA